VKNRMQDKDKNTIIFSDDYLITDENTLQYTITFINFVLLEKIKEHTFSMHLKGFFN
jgi:hypothetical protein